MRDCQSIGTQLLLSSKAVILKLGGARRFQGGRKHGSQMVPIIFIKLWLNTRLPKPLSLFHMFSNDYFLKTCQKLKI